MEEEKPSKLKQLVEDSPCAQSPMTSADEPAPPPVDEEPAFLKDDSKLEKTRLGEAIDGLMMNWCQLLTNVNATQPVPPPSTLDHVKEVAEVCSKHFRDSCVDVMTEFHMLGVQWELEHPAEQFQSEIRDVEEAIQRQEQLLEKIEEVVEQRGDEYLKEFVNAGRFYRT